MKTMKRIFMIALTIIMTLSMSTSAFAAELAIEHQTAQEETVVPCADYPAVTGTIVPDSDNYGTIKLYPTCTQGMILKLHVSTSSSSTSGAILLSMYDKNGDLVSSDWVMGTNDEAVFDLPWFSPYGTYSLTVYGHGIKSNVRVYAYLSN